MVGARKRGGDAGEVEGTNSGWLVRLVVRASTAKSLWSEANAGGRRSVFSGAAAARPLLDTRPVETSPGRSVRWVCLPPSGGVSLR